MWYRKIYIYWFFRNLMIICPHCKKPIRFSPQERLVISVLEGSNAGSIRQLSLRTGLDYSRVREIVYGLKQIGLVDFEETFVGQRRQIKIKLNKQLYEQFKNLLS